MKTKLKTKSAVAKRFKVTGTGKVKKAKSNHRHLLTNKNHKLKRHHTRAGYLTDADQDRIKVMLPYA